MELREVEFLTAVYHPDVPSVRCATCRQRFTPSGHRKHLSRYTGKCPKFRIVASAWLRRTIAKENRLKREKSSGPGWTRAQWLALLDHYGNTCVCCGFVGRLVPDHVTPLFRGGAHNMLNIQPLCYKCNFRKGLQIIDYR